METALQLCGYAGKSKGRGATGPCPVCGGKDRFSVNFTKRKWGCRQCRKAGSDALSLALHGEALPFKEAVSQLACEEWPNGSAESEEDRKAREERRATQKAEREKRASAQARVAEQERNKARDDALRIWAASLPAVSMEAEVLRRYFAHRALDTAPLARIRFHPSLPYYDPEGTRLFDGPAMVTPIVQVLEGASPPLQITGVHMTWLDPALMTGEPVRAKGKRVLDGGLPAKKMKGWKKGGWMVLARPDQGRNAHRLFIGEGIETMMAYRRLLMLSAPEIADGWWYAAGDLGNLCGGATDRVRHPTETSTDKNGVVRPVMVAGMQPDKSDRCFVAAEQFTDVTLVADGDSEPFRTLNDMTRAARRNAKRGRKVRVVWPENGRDFADMAMEAA
jgi:hypothetical protein